ncbi:soluble guanylate cyclase 88E-like isoform X2 [Physella acuta]|uniref:soluble guanylate cyclase 88E-like isoform X2 n=1 Tax=Physella acuta TaxID=109671 RepID=UPI0027DB41E1|nr:soluble guanylate cyclase 88E-like isoform X2 [Physella acuta]
MAFRELNETTPTISLAKNSFGSTPSGSSRRHARGRMYGMLFESIQFFIKQDYGTDIWSTVLDAACIPNVIFIPHKTYPDEWMVNLAKATCHVLGNALNDVMLYFGTCFVNFCCKFSYDKILRLAGRNYRDFLNEIDNVHETIRFSHPKMQSPSFIVQSEDKSGCILIYRSMRTGFTYYVIGQLMQCAKKFYAVDVDITVLEEIVTEKGCHVTFRLQFDNRGFTPSGEKGDTGIYLSSYPEIKSSTFFKLFPFCLVFNAKMKIIGCGGNLASLLKTKDLIGSSVTDMFSLRRPLVDFTWTNTMCLQKVIFEVEWRKEDLNNDFMSSGIKTARYGDKRAVNFKRLLLRGQMKYIKDWEAVAFLCTPLLGNLDDMLKTGIYLHDLNMFDNSRDLVLAGQQCASDLEYSMEKQTAWSRQIEDTLQKLDKARQQSENLINSMLTKSIADRLKLGDDALSTCEAFPQVTILFSYLVRFSDICTEGSPMQVVQCIQNVTEVYDKIVEKYKLFKVETLGDGVYMVAGGVPDKCLDHAQKVAGLALELVENAMYVKNPITGAGMQVRIGMHTGSVVAGIVGKRTPQYCLFGDTVNTAARMQTNSEPGRIHLTQPCHDCLKGTEYLSVYRGRIQVKGKGEMKTYWLAGKQGAESTKIMCRILKEEHQKRRQGSVENPYDLHALHNSTSASNFISIYDLNDEDEKELELTLNSVFDGDSTMEHHEAV